MPQPFANAIRQLKAAPNYSWTTVAEFPDAPFKVTPINGAMGANGYAIVKCDAGKQEVAIQGKVRVWKGISGWQAPTPGNAKDPAVQDLLSAQTPTGELSELAIMLNEVKTNADYSFTVNIDPATAKAYLQSSLKGRAPSGVAPEIKTASGNLRLLLKEGFPQKYTITIDAVISLPFGTKTVARKSTTEIKDVGTTSVELPPEARQALENMNPKTD